jgi:hypothetical protein
MEYNFEKALSKVKDWQMQLGSAAQYHIDAGDRSSFDECQATNEIYETIAFALKFTAKELWEPSEEALLWSKTLIKYQVKPELCVDRNDEPKSALEIYEQAVTALTAIRNIGSIGSIGRMGMPNFECGSCGGPKQDAYYRACESCRSKWRKQKKPPTILGELQKQNKMLAEAVVAFAEGLQNSLEVARYKKNEPNLYDSNLDKHAPAITLANELIGEK